MQIRQVQHGLLLSLLFPMSALASEQGLLGTLIIGATQGALLMIIALLYYWAWKPYRQKAIARDLARKATELPEIVVRAAEGDLDGVRTWLDRGINPDIAGRKGETALMLAARNGRLEVVELLLDRGANPMKASNSGSTAKDVARTYGHGHVEQVIKNFQTRSNGGKEPNIA